MSLKMMIVLASAVSFALAGCATVCLQIPASSKVENEVVERCKTEVETNLGRRDLFDRYVRILWARGEHAKVVALARRVLKQDPERTDARFYLAVGLRKLGKCKWALRHYRAYAKRRSSDADPYFGIALCHEALGDRAAAIAAYRDYMAREKRPDKAGWRRRATRRIAALEGGTALGTATPGGGLATLGTRGAARPRVPRRVTARPRVTRRVAARPRVPPPVVARTPRPTPTLAPPPKPAPPANCDAPAAAIKKNPFDTAAYDRFARCGLARKDYPIVAKRMRIAVRDNPDWSKGWLYLGQAYQAAGQAARAKRAFARACKAGVAGGCGH